MLKFSRMIIWLAAGATLFMLGLMSGHAQLGPHGNSTPSVETDRQLELLGKVLDIVRSEYVDKSDNGKLITSAINGILGALDPSSSYMDEQSLREMQSNHAVGLGVWVIMEDGVLKVVSPIDDTPAARAGLLAGDVITQIDDIPIKGLTLDQAVLKMRGGPRTEARLEIVRLGEVAPRNLTLTRQMVTVPPVRQQAEEGNVGYVRITQFNDGRAADLLKKAIETLATTTPREQFKGYILDLRNNPGGLLDHAVQVAGAFLTTGSEIVSVRGRDPEQVQRFNAARGDLIDGKPLIVLINGGSYRVSEIIAGALQDHKRATIVGSRTFGKASAPTIIPLGRGNGALRLTTGHYYTPSERSIQQGIAPDIEVLQELPKEQAQAQTRSECSDTSLPGHLKAERDERKGPQSYIPKDPKDDKALQTALALIRGTETNPAFSPDRKQGAAEP
jgi:carboxyl-terminal processing protease